MRPPAHLCLVFSFISVMPTLALADPLVVPIAQDRYVTAAAGFDCMGSEESDFDEQTAIDYGPFVAHVEASVSDMYCGGWASADQDSEILADRLVASGAMSVSAGNGSAGQYGTAGASADSHFEVTFELIQESEYAFGGVVSTSSWCNDSRAVLRDDTGIIHLFRVPDVDLGDLPFDVSGVLAPGQYSLLVKSSGWADPQDWSCQGEASYDVTLAFQSTTGAITEEAAPPRVTLRIHPNPMRPGGTIEWVPQNPGTTTLKLFDPQGHLLLTRNHVHSGSGTQQVRWSELLGRKALSSGVYFLELEEQGGHQQVARIIVTH